MFEKKMTSFALAGTFLMALTGSATIFANDSLTNQEPATHAQDVISPSIIQAAISNNMQKLQKALGAGADVNAVNKNGDAALMWAAFNGNIEAVELLLKAGADANIASKFGDTPLMWATMSGQKAVARILIDHGADVNAKTKFNVTPLMEAAGGGHTEIMKMILERKPDLYVVDGGGNNALIWALRVGKNKTADLIRAAMKNDPRGIVDSVDYAAKVKRKKETKTQQSPLKQFIGPGSHEQLIAQGGPVLVEFYADWCPTCRALEPFLDELAQEADGAFRILKVDIDTLRSGSLPDRAFLAGIIQENRIRGVPAIALFNEGKCVGVKNGYAGRRDNEKIRLWLEQNLRQNNVAVPSINLPFLK